MGTPAGQRRDHTWFESLFREHHRAVLAYALRRAGADADDVVADVFAVAWRRREEVPDQPLPWLYRTAAHQILHVHRGAARRDGLTTRLAGQPPPPGADDPIGDQVSARIDAARVLQALAGLPPSDAEVLQLWAWEGLDAAALGAVLGCTSATARVRLFRARRRAGALLAAEGAARRAVPASAPDLQKGGIS